MLRAGRTTVDQPGFPQRLAHASAVVQSVTLIAITGQSGIVWCGGPETSGVPGSEHGFPLDKSGAYAELRMRTYTGVDLKDIWIDAPNVGDGVTWEARV